jgi:Sulfotransferase family
MELALDRFLCWNDLILGSSPFGEVLNSLYENRFGLHKHSSVSDIETICGDDICENYYVFALVRHPVDRLCSLYNFAGSVVHKWAADRGISPKDVTTSIANDSQASTPALRWPSSQAFIATTSFSEFIHDQRLAADNAFRTQVSRLRSLRENAIRAQFFRLEDRDVWLSRVKDALGLDFNFTHTNESELKLITTDAVLPEDRSYLKVRFAEDYATFDYH